MPATNVKGSRSTSIEYKFEKKIQQGSLPYSTCARVARIRFESCLRGGQNANQLSHQSFMRACRGNTPPFTEEQIAAYTPLVSPDWVVVNNVKLVRPFTHQNFLRSLLFVNAIAFLAEKEGHHPDLIINYNQVTVEITTHAIHGLSRNDFIIAAKVDDLIRYK